MGILVFSTLHLGLILMRATASYLSEGLVAVAIEPYAADHDGVSAIGGEIRPCLERDSNRGLQQPLSLNLSDDYLATTVG